MLYCIVFQKMFFSIIKSHQCVRFYRNVPSINFIGTVQTKDLRVLYWKCLSEQEIIVMKIKCCYTIVCFPCLIFKRTFFYHRYSSHLCILVSALNCTHCHHQDGAMTEIHTGKSNWCKIRATAALAQEKSQAVPGLWGSNDTQCYLLHLQILPR